MSTVTRDSIGSPTLARQVVAVQGLGGEVIVRGLLLSERLALSLEAGRGAPQMVPRLLALSVLADDDQPLWTEAQWDAWGGSHPEDVMRLWEVARRLSALDAEAAEGN